MAKFIGRPRAYRSGREPQRLTHLLADAGANRITATTDTTNTPMVAGFARGGYPITRHRILLTHR